MQAITRENARGWNIRVPRLFIAIGMPVTLAIASITTPTVGDMYYRSAEEAVSWFEFLGNSLVGVAILAAAAAWHSPRLCLWICSSLALLTASVSGEIYVQIFGVAWLFVAFIDLHLMLRQRAVATAWYGGDAPVALGPGEPSSWFDFDLVPRLIAAVVFVAVALGTFGWYVYERAELIALESRAVPATASVTDVDTFFDSIYMTVDGEEYEFFVNDADDYAVGSKAPVFVDPTGEHRPYGAEDVDPPGMMDLAVVPGAALILATSIIATPRRRRSQAFSLLYSSLPRTSALLARNPYGDGFFLFAADDSQMASPLILIPELVVVKVPDLADEWGDDGLDVDEDVPAPEPEQSNWYAPLARGLILIGDALDFDFDAWKHIEDDGDYADERPHHDGELVFVRGLHADGSMLVIEYRNRVGDSIVSMTSRPVRDPWTFLRLTAPAVDRFNRRQPSRHRGDSAALDSAASASRSPADIDMRRGDWWGRIAAKTSIFGSPDISVGVSERLNGRTPSPV